MALFCTVRRDLVSLLDFHSVAIFTTLCELFAPVLIVGISQEFDRQQVSSGFMDAFDYSSLS